MLKAASGRLGAGNGSGTPDTNTGAQLTPAQKSDIAAFLDMSEDNIKSRYESNEHNGYDAPVEVFEYVETVTLKKGDGSWHWASSSSDNADKYVVSDEKGNAYTYFAIEKTPDNYVTTYRYDSAESAKLTDKKTETITNRQINLQGTKEWDDEENRQNRPDSLTIHLYKVTYDKADNTEKSATEISPLNVDWVKDENTDTWTYTIKNLTKPVETDTERQVYRVVEDVPSGYTAEVSSVEGSAVSNNTDLGSLTVTKTVSGDYTATDTDAYPITVKKGEAFVTGTVNGTTITYTGLSDTDPQYTVKAGDANKLTFVNLPVGEYVVTEGSISNNGYIITTTYKVNGTDATTASAAVTKGTATAVDITNHYRNAKLNILKVEKDSDTPLQDAEFTLYKIDETSSSLNEDKTTERKVTTNGQGQASFELLSIGYYVIRETNPPTGYVITGENSFYIEVTDTGINLLTKGEGAPNTWAKDATSYGNVKTFTVAADSSAQATVENVPGAALPSTGGHGTDLIYLLGIMLTGLAGAGLLIRQRRKTV